MCSPESADQPMGGNWWLGKPSEDDTVVFPATEGRTITNMRVEGTMSVTGPDGKTVEYRGYPKVDFEAPIDVLAGIAGPPDTLKPPPLHLWRRLCLAGAQPVANAIRKWMSRPRRKPFLKPSRETAAQFEVWMFKKGLAQ